ncbi:MAG: TAT-variant-translocated molybdopterin oxidoreductase [candidate division Zixibacteria bacterium]|nr:TAT-variant-translocated molybdopterin oxidoreductase [candidate division Zixibacteria bacterium]
MKDDLKIFGRDYWRSLDQLAQTPKFKEFLEAEFPSVVDDNIPGLSRRKFLTLMGASIALAGVAGCRRPVEKIIPYVTQPEEIVPGVPNTYATTMPLGTAAYGLLVECNEGRPTKIEGNPDHPSTRGRSNAIMQASILGLYDPDRSKRVTQNGNEKSWEDFVSYWRSLHSSYDANGGNGLAVLSESFASPTLARLKKQFTDRFPNAEWVSYEPASDENIHEGVKVATGESLYPVYKFENAETILSLDSDFLLTETDNIRNATGFAEGRRVESVNDSMNRLYCVESDYSLTGAMADHRLRLRSSQVGAFTAALALEMQSQGLAIEIGDALSAYRTHAFDTEWLAAVAKDLIAARGKSLVIAGRRQPASVHALILLINDVLGNVDNAIELVQQTYTSLPSNRQFSDLVDKMRSGKIKSLVVLGCNPIYNAPADADFAGALKQLQHTIHFGIHADETAQLSEWHIPQSHYLESWGDATAIDGTRSLIQPMIEPLFGAHSSAEMMMLLATGIDARGYDIVRQTWQEIWTGAGFEKKWRRALHDGVIKTDASNDLDARVIKQNVASLLSREPFEKSKSDSTIEIAFKISPSVHDGRFANNGWLQELPDPITKLSWDNAAVMSELSAREFAVANEDIITLSVDGRQVDLPVWIVPGVADKSIVLELGFGRTSAGGVANNVGSNAYRLRTRNRLWFVGGASIFKTGRKLGLANTQDHGSMEGRPIVRESTLTEYRIDPEFAREMVEHPPLESLWDDHKYDKGYQWGMTIDLNACIGCGACTIACQSENNIALVGKEQVRNGREMHWIRVDRYYTGEVKSPEMVHQPVACQHCEMAPCETVCPVNATVHDREGLNVMVYNRCIGTRYCSNNCPYKVRRFNFFNYTNNLADTIKMAQNPDVTVRSRGVMEKCTFCVQRINSAKFKAKKDGRNVGDGEIRTACQQACPADAIKFGDIRDSKSEVARLKKLDRNYEVLAEFNTRPRTSYLAKLGNPNPELKKAQKKIT